MLEGIRSGSRLDMLRDLKRRVDAEIRAEEKLERSRTAIRAYKAKQEARRDSVSQRLARLGVTAHDVKTWALEQGLITEIRRGRVSGDLVDAYAADHPTIRTIEGAAS